MTKFRLAALACAAALVSGLTPASTPRADASALAFTGIRPGTSLLQATSVAGRMAYVPWCTANFVFQEAPGAFDADGPLYIATAAHCYALGASVRAAVIPPDGSTAVQVTIGTVVLDTPDNPDDIAIIEIDPAYYDWVSPSTAYWGGPTGVYAGGSNLPVTTVGHGLGTGTGGTPRTGVLQTGGASAYRAHSWATVGDSGSPVATADGLAVGHIADENTNLATDTGVAGVSWTGPAVPLVESVSGLYLSTCPSRTPWPAPGCPPV